MPLSRPLPAADGSCRICICACRAARTPFWRGCAAATAAASFVERCRRIAAALDMPAFSTDVIVGFPGETDADFEATCAVAREVGFSKIHVFSWSPRRGTPAALLDGRVAAANSRAIDANCYRP